MHYYLHLHVKLGHPSHQVCVKWLQDNMTTEQIQTRYGKIAAIFCQYCAKAKVKAAPVSKVVVEKAKDFGDKIHMDVAGKFQRPARGTSYNYELAFVDSATGYIKLYPMTSCAEVTTIAAKHLQWVANRRKKMQATSNVTGNTTVVKQELLWNEGEYSVNLGCRIVGDSAMYFRSVDMNTIVNRFGFELNHTPPYHQHANGLVERAWQSIHTRSAAIRDAAGLNYNCWWYTDNHAAKLHNSFPSTIRGGKSPHELVYGDKLNIDKYKTIGQEIVVKRQVRNKDQSKGRVGIWLGWNEMLTSNIIGFQKTSTDLMQPPIVHSKDVLTDKKPTLFKKLLNGKANVEAPGYIPYDINGEIDGNLYDVDTNNIWKDGSYKSGIELLVDGGDQISVNSSEPTAKRPRLDNSSTTSTPLVQPTQSIITQTSAADIDLSEDLTSADGTGTIDASFWQANLMVGKKYSNAKKAFADKEFGHLHRQSAAAEKEQLEFFGVLTECRISEAKEAKETIHRPVQTIGMKGNAAGQPNISKTRTMFNGSNQEMCAGQQTFTFTPKQCTIRSTIAEAAGGGCKLFCMDLPNAFSQSIAPNAKYMYFPKGTDEKHDPITGELIIYRLITFMDEKMLVLIFKPIWLIG